MIKKLIFFSIFISSAIAFSQEIKLTKRNFETFNNDLYSYQYLDKLMNVTAETQYLIRNWVLIDRVSGTPDKNRLKDCHQNIIPDLLSKLNLLSTAWSPYEQDLLSEIKFQLDTLFSLHNYVMSQLSNFESYEDPFVVFEVIPMVDRLGVIGLSNDKAFERIRILRKTFYQKSEKYLLPFYKEDQESVVDIKLLAVKVFIKTYGLEELVINETKFQMIYNYYTYQELNDAINEKTPKNIDFYNKYNLLILKLSDK